MYNGATEQVMGKKLSPKSLKLPVVLRYCVMCCWALHCCILFWAFVESCSLVA